MLNMYGMSEVEAYVKSITSAILSMYFQDGFTERSGNQ